MAKRCFLVILFCSLYHLPLFARPGLPPVYVIDIDSVSYVEIGDSSLQMLEDPSGKWTINMIVNSPLSEKFHSNSTYDDGVGYSNHTYWIRCRVRNNMSHRVDLYFYPQYADRIDYYFSAANGGWDHKITGYLYSDDNKNIFNVNYFEPFSVDSGQELTIYARYYVNYYYYNNYSRPRYLTLIYGSQKKFIESYNESSMFPAIEEAVFFGVLIIAVIYNLLFFWTVRERTYLYFSLFLLTFTPYYCTTFLYSTNFYHEHPRLFNYTTNFWGPLYLFFELNFIRHFFKTWQYTPRWNKYLIGISVFQLVARIFAVFLGRTLAIPGSELLWKIDLANSYLVSLFILITFFIFVRKRTPYTNLLLLAALPFTLYLTIIRTSTIAFDLFGGSEHGTIYKIILWLKRWNYIFYLVSVFWLIIFFTLILFFRYKRLQKENVQQTLDKERLAREKEIERSELIEKQKLELEHQVKERTGELKQSLEELKTTQAQLIQSEKMASLGELTAGIAHEIQNPLNFVNNFSEVSRELLDEMKTELEKDNKEEANAIAEDVQQNLEKVIYHGKRADAIVKGMLQHSRSSSGKKEPTDINALVDEYLRLSYHGLRAKDKSFNAKFETNFDPLVEKINVVPQDIGRVILNLINNAFYAVNERKLQAASGKQQDAYEPTVSVGTKKIGNEIEIRVTDNGNGIPQKVLDKIFQPFFTTKPTGQGTGLGLSLSYDIIKAHNGGLKVETKEGEGTVFIVQLPIKDNT